MPNYRDDTRRDLYCYNLFGQDNIESMFNKLPLNAGRRHRVADDVLFSIHYLCATIKARLSKQRSKQTSRRENPAIF